MSAGLRMVDATFISAFMSTLLYGFYLAVAYECSRVLYLKRRQRRVNIYLVGTHVALLILVSVRCIISMTRALVGLRFHQQPDGDIDFGSLNAPHTVLANVSWLLCILISDAFIIYRVYVVWRGNWYAVAPVLFGWIANCGSGIWLLYSTVAYGEGAATAGAFDLYIRANIANIACMVFTLYTNLLSSLLIAFRIWHIRRDVQYLTTGARDAVQNLVVILLESAGFYTVLLVVHIIMLGMDSLVIYILTDMEAPTIGIVFSYIIIRVSEGTAHGNTSSGGPTSGDTSGPRRTWTSGARAGQGTNNIDVAIRLETVTHHDNEEPASDTKSTDKTRDHTEW
ncbi:hypothetical protein BD626DRAFT_221085 [Schizophyllum amplum]|uniref:THH1/TOM1/TOM3 domain-containing protein n=1 Tax=Schizophyllum amplum TaxID=97359 RepID=A0A550CLH6_9AGAR|nr:hypothetical protein BD626DRAFT_221085 [Auriculariopsis ampla]